MNRRQVVAAFALALAGCYPVQREVYLADASDGRALREQCNTVAGQGAKWQFREDGIVVEVGVSAAEGILWFSIAPPDGVKVRLASAVLQWSATSDGPWRDAPLGDAHFWQRADTAKGERRPPVWTAQSPAAVMTGEHASLAGLPLVPRTYSFQAPVGGPLPPSLYLRLPALQRGERDLRFPVVHFAKRRGWYVEGVVPNC